MQDASRIFLELTAAGLRPDIITFNTFVASYALHSMFVEAVDVVKYMIKQGYRPNENTYNSIVDGYCKHGRQVEANAFILNLRKLDSRITKEEESRLSQRMAKN